MMSHDMLKHQVNQHWLHDMNFLSRRKLHRSMIVVHMDAGIHAFLVLLPLKCCEIAPFIPFIIIHLFLRLVALHKSLTMILMSFLCSKCNQT